MLSSPRWPKFGMIILSGKKLVFLYKKKTIAIHRIMHVKIAKFVSKDMMYT